MADVANSNLRVPAELELAGQQLQAKATLILEQLDALRAKLAPLQDTWQGPAWSYYQDLQNQWNMAAEGLFGENGILGHIASAVNVSWNNYVVSESDNVRTWKG
ncbi:WXG100 family type VII secretion target [Actinoplanes sp. RD1]|uniref:WXG100 family type VII secretion target n=1 Tax=Actinoplanes sp. RD1 TaxID=3064538 RepID=UPI002741C4B4|nr:WXG100 family type VII secretion target [Actinoplanes sp. RD1]